MILNIIVIALIGLIAYWWSTQGFLSGLLHLVCVICAAATAMAVWELIYVDHMLSTSAWSGLWPGTILLTVFAVTLLIMRSLSDKLAGGNTRLPDITDRIGGGVMGALAGVITAGMLLIGTGFIDRPHETLGVKQWIVDASGDVVRDDASSLWVPADQLTSDLFEMTSQGSLYPDLSGTPLATLNPDLDRQAWLLRLRPVTEDNAYGQMFQPAESITSSGSLRLTEELAVDGQSRLLIPFRVESRDGMDYGRQFVVGNNQIRLVGSRDGKTETLHPVGWRQLVFNTAKVDNAALGENYETAYVEFNQPERHIYDVGKTPIDINLMFEIEEGFVPHSLQVRGTRTALSSTVDDAKSFDSFLRRAGINMVAAGEKVDPWGNIFNESQINLRGALPRGARPTRDIIRGEVTFDEESSKITSARNAVYPKRRTGKARSKLNVRGYGYRMGENGFDQNFSILKLQVGPTTNTNILAAIRGLGGDARIELVDEEASGTTTYVPKGAELSNDREVTINFGYEIPWWKNLKKRPRYGSEDQFALIFILPASATPDSLWVRNAAGQEEMIGEFENFQLEPQPRK